MSNGPKSLRRATRLAVFGRTHAALSRSPRTWWPWLIAFVGKPRLRLPLVALAIILPLVLGVPSYDFIPWAPLRTPLPHGSTVGFLAAAWSLEATIYVVIAGVAGLLIVIAPSPTDKGRLLEAYRHNGFDWVAVFGLAVVLMTGWRVFALSVSTDTTPIRLGAIVGIMVLIPLHVAAMGGLVVYGHWLLSQALSFGSTFRSLQNEIERSIASDLMAPTSREVLTDWLRNNPSDIRVWVYDPQVVPELATEFEVTLGRLLGVDGRRYMYDLRLRRLSKWLGHLASVGTAAATPPIVAMRIGIGVGIAPSDVLVKCTVPVSDEALRELRSCFKFSIRLEEDNFRSSLSALRDRAIAAARSSQSVEFEFALQAFEHLYVGNLQARYGSPKDLSQQQEIKSGDYLPTRDPLIVTAVALRDALQRIGEEVVASTSISMISAWLTIPQQLLPEARRYPMRSESPSRGLFYLWVRAAELTVDGWVQRPDIVSEVLFQRLYSYASDLMKEVRLPDDDWSRVHDRVEDELRNFVMACGGALPAIEIRGLGSSATLIDQLTRERAAGRIPDLSKGLKAFWFAYCLWLVRQVCHGEADALPAGGPAIWTRACRELNNGRNLLEGREEFLLWMRRWANQRSLLAHSPEEATRGSLGEAEVPNVIANIPFLLAADSLRRRGALFEDRSCCQELAELLLEIEPTSDPCESRLTVLSSDEKPTSLSDRCDELLRAVWRVYMDTIAAEPFDPVQASAGLTRILTNILGPRFRQEPDQLVGLSQWVEVRHIAIVTREVTANSTELSRFPQLSRSQGEFTRQIQAAIVRHLVNRRIAGVTPTVAADLAEMASLVNRVLEESRSGSGSQLSWAIACSPGEMSGLQAAGFESYVEQRTLQKVVSLPNVVNGTHRSRLPEPHMSEIEHLNSGWWVLFGRDAHIDQSAARYVIYGRDRQYSVKVAPLNATSSGLSPAILAQVPVALQPLMLVATVDVHVEAEKPDIVQVFRLRHASPEAWATMPQATVVLTEPWARLAQFSGASS